MTEYVPQKKESDSGLTEQILPPDDFDVEYP